ncbi:MAG: hypothetical protein SVW51_16000 [Pseudomonadota bacterium]|nr:hypothetical protein [Pseudomonadota bacterium]
MNKFEKQNFFTLFACFLVFCNFAAEHYSCASFCTFMNMEFDFNFYRSILMLIGSALSLVGLICTLFKYTVGLKICLITYLFQTLGFVLDGYHFVLSFGVIINWSIAIGNSSLEIGLVGVLMSLLLYTALLKVKTKKKPSEQTGSIT